MRRNFHVPRGARRSGLTVLESTIAIAIVLTALLATARGLAGSVRAVSEAQHLSRGTAFLETVFEDLSAQPYAELLAFHGNRLLDRETAGASSWAVDLTVFQAGVDLIQVQAALTDVRSGERRGSLTTLRAPR